MAAAEVLRDRQGVVLPAEQPVLELVVLLEAEAVQLLLVRRGVRVRAGVRVVQGQEGMGLGRRLVRRPRPKMQR